MNYLFYGTNRFLINKEIENLQKKYSINSINISKYDFDASIIDDIVNDCEAYSLFSDTKMIIVDETDIFKNASKKSNEEEVEDTKIDLTKLEKYLLNPNPNAILIFICNSDSINPKKKITKAFLTKGKSTLFDNDVNNIALIKKIFEGYEIDQKTIMHLINRVGNDTGNLYQECEKLVTYKFDEKEINIDDIDELVNKNIDLDFFKFIENIITKNKEDALEQYYEMIKRKEPPIKIMVTLSKQIRIMYQSKILREKGYSTEGIAELLGEKVYYVSQCLKKSYNFSEEELCTKLEELADMDINIKTGKIIDSLALELFIINQ